MVAVWARSPVDDAAARAHLLPAGRWRKIEGRITPVARKVELEQGQLVLG